MADKAKQNKRQTKKLNAKQLSVLFGSHKPRAATEVRHAHVHPIAKPKPAPKLEQKPTLKPKTAELARRSTDKPTLPDPIEWSQNLAHIAGHSQRLLTEFAQRQQQAGTHPILPTSVISSFMELTGHMMSNPMQLFSAQSSLWRQYFELWQHSTRRFISGDSGQPHPHTHTDSNDRRFKDPAWQENPLFDYIKQSYLLTARWLQGQVHQVKGIDSAAKKKIDFYTKQFVDALSPSNFALTNPQVLRATLETGGENLLRGLDNLLHDLESGRIRMTDEKAFTVGKNLAMTEGEVVFQNELIQLIQYKATTEEVAEVPLLIFPPWINKFYILDMKPENSFIKWAVDQGLTVFCVSWVNPDRKLAQLTFEDYMTKGVLAAMTQAKKHSHCNEVNIIGYCLGGTLLASTLAYLHATNPKLAQSVRSATYFVTLVDFKDPGDLGIFIDDTQMEALERQMTETGYLDAAHMANTFNLLRANDLIWSFVVNNYLLGKEPFPFDLLYWNSDSTRMPAAMHTFYLRNMYQKNLLAKPGGITLNDVPIDLTTITTPSYLLSTREDHITPWTSTYAATKIYKGDITFTLAGSGHIAGVVNPPVANKYSYWTNEDLPPHPHDWLATATEHEGSWWPHWRKWLEKHCGKHVKARTIHGGLEPAPGSYVKVRVV